METFIILIAGSLFSVGTYLILSKSILRILLGTSVFTHAVHLMMLAVTGLKRGMAPILESDAAVFTDALPQALILTSIVINFALTSLFLVIGYRIYKELGTDDLEQLRGTEYE